VRCLSMVWGFCWGSRASVRLAGCVNSVFEEESL